MHANVGDCPRAPDGEDLLAREFEPFEPVLNERHYDRVPAGDVHELVDPTTGDRLAFELVRRLREIGIEAEVDPGRWGKELAAGRGRRRARGGSCRRGERGCDERASEKRSFATE